MRVDSRTQLSGLAAGLLLAGVGFIVHGFDTLHTDQRRAETRALYAEKGQRGPCVPGEAAFTEVPPREVPDQVAPRSRQPAKRAWRVTCTWQAGGRPWTDTFMVLHDPAHPGSDAEREALFTVTWLPEDPRRALLGSLDEALPPPEGRAPEFFGYGVASLVAAVALGAALAKMLR